MSSPQSFSSNTPSASRYSMILDININDLCDAYCRHRRALRLEPIPTPRGVVLVSCISHEARGLRSWTRNAADSHDYNVAEEPIKILASMLYNVSSLCYFPFLKLSALRCLSMPRFLSQLRCQDNGNHGLDMLKCHFQFRYRSKDWTRRFAINVRGMELCIYNYQPTRNAAGGVSPTRQDTAIKHIHCTISGRWVDFRWLWISVRSGSVEFGLSDNGFFKHVEHFAGHGNFGACYPPDRPNVSHHEGSDTGQAEAVLLFLAAYT